MTEYGAFPGIKVTTSAGTITSVDVGFQETLVLFGRGAPDALNRDADYNTVEGISARREADRKFGDGSELAEAMRAALSNGANIEELYGVMPEERGAGGNIDTQADTPTESVSSTQTGTLNNAPLIEEDAFIEVRDTTDSVDMAVNFVYEASPATPSDANTININSQTGEFAADASSDYDFFYNYLDWSAALPVAEQVVNESDSGLYVTLSEAESVASSLESEIGELRDDYRMINGLAGAEPNLTENGGPAFDTANYSDSLESDYLFLLAPTRLDGSRETVLGASAGLFSGAPLSDPIYNNQLDLDGRSLNQRLTRTEADELRSEQVIPLREAGSIRIRGNTSTSTESDWPRDFWRRRIVDRSILLVKEIGDETVGRINDEQTISSAERTIQTELQSLANDRLIKSNAPDETNLFVDVYRQEGSLDTVNIDFGITPQGVVKSIESTITIDS